VDPAIAGAWIGFGGGIVASLGGVFAGNRVAVSGDRRKGRQAAAVELADLGKSLASDHGFADVNHAVDKLAISLAAANTSSDVIKALREVAVECNRASVHFAQQNPTAQPVVDEELYKLYSDLFSALTEQLQRTGTRNVRRQHLVAAQSAISQRLPH
jgi:hypothetical protein